MKLPVLDIREALQASLKQNQPIVLSAPTGSGKSTQVPKMVLETLAEGQKVVVLQPRRLAARMLAERVAFEMGVELGSLVGFQTRYERVLSRDTRILFITEGILTRMMVSNPQMPDIGAIIFDEFHERSVNTDLGLAMALHCRQHQRNDLRLIVMSATLDIVPLLAYLPDSVHLHAEGRLYPVTISYLKPPFNRNVFANAAAALCDILNSHAEGDILIFMPGGYEIRKTEDECRHIRSAEPLEILPLYGDLPPEAQRAVMNPCDRRKVIIATNIAETSLTIPGVRHVIDSGLVRVNRYEPARGIDILETKPIARDSAEQRTGRAGREGEGTCHRLWSEQEQSMKPSRSIPEIARIDLAETVLAVASYGFHDPAAFPWYEQPAEKPLNEAVHLLEQLGALRKDFGGLTELGQQLQMMPVHPRLALLMVLGANHGCFTETAKAAALLSGRPLSTGAVAGKDVVRQRRADVRARGRAEKHVLPESDFLVQMSLLDMAHDSHFAPDFCEKIGVHGGAARDAWRAYEDFLHSGQRLGWYDSKAEHSVDDNLTEAFLCCLLRAFPDRLAKRRDQGTLVCEMSGGRRAELSKDSVVRDEPLFVAAELRENASGGTQGTKTLLGVASGVREQWLWEEFEEQLTETDELFWDERSQRVFRRVALSCLGVTLEETMRQDPDPEGASELLASKMIDGKLPIPNWDEDCDKWVARVQWLRGVFPEHPLPEYNDEDKAKIYRILCEGVTSYRAVKEKNFLDAVKHLLSGADIQFVEQNAPAVIMLPKGRRMKIEYTPGQAPKGRARIQDIYDMTKTIKVAGGRVSILMDILAPNNRTVQITEDMESFWAVQYPKIKPALSRRYPRHEWR